MSIFNLHTHENGAEEFIWGNLIQLTSQKKNDCLIRSRFSLTSLWLEKCVIHWHTRYSHYFLPPSDHEPIKLWVAPVKPIKKHKKMNLSFLSVSVFLSFVCHEEKKSDLVATFLFAYYIAKS